jgi:hypothetical protein
LSPLPFPFVSSAHEATLLRSEEALLAVDNALASPPGLFKPAYLDRFDLATNNAGNAESPDQSSDIQRPNLDMDE